MSDTLTAAPSAAPAAPVTPETLEQAGNALKSATSWEALGLSTDGMAVTAGDPEETPETPETPAAEQTETPAETPAPEFVQNEQGQWHRPDGTFANAEEIAAIEAQIAADAPPATEPPEVKPETVAIRRRDGTMREVVIDDPELAQEIRQNVNDGMRRREFTELKATYDAKLSEFKQLETLLQTNPEAVILDSLTPEAEIRVTQALVAKHFDALLPVLQKYDTDPSSRIAATAEAQLRMREQQTQFESARSAGQQAAALRGAVETLIPDTIAPETAEQFWADASMDLQRALSRGEKVDPSTVPALLQSRMKLYGFDAPAGHTPAATPTRIALAPPASGTSPVAVPANDPAKALQQAKATQRRITLTQRNRTNAAAVPPVGAGAAPVRLPPVPAGASIEEAARAMKKQRTWTTS